MTIINITQEEDLAIAPTLLLFLFSLIAYLYLYRFIKEIKQWQHKVFLEGHDTAASIVELYGLPSKEDLNELEN